MLADTFDNALPLPQLVPRRWLVVKRPAFIQVLIQSQPFRVFQMILGFLLMAVGPLLLAPTPGPFGTIVFAFGLALILRNSPWARRRYVRYSRRYPRVQKMVNFGLRRKQKRKSAVLVAATHTATRANSAEPGA
jgi:hypothetical protein